jgi:dihydrofolate reductase
VGTRIDREADPILAFVVAVARNGVIGRDGRLPWRLSSDLKTFRRLTMGKPLIMGRKTWNSLGRPLDGRDNIVVTRDHAFAADGALVAHDIAGAVAMARDCAAARGADEIMVIGGSHIFAALMNDVRRLYWTDVEAEPEGDVTFPPLDARQWREVSREALPRGPKDEFPATLRVLERADR